MIQRKELEKLYLTNKASMMEISRELGCSVQKIQYWMDKYQLPRRSISDAIYQKANPNGDPFKIKPIRTLDEAQLLGLGIGLYWGEGNKKNKHSIRLGNTDPVLIKEFMRFLITLFEVDKNRLKFGLQIFSDIDPDAALNYWIEELDIKAEQFSKVIVTQSGSIGTYRQKSQYGVLTLHFNNKKLRDIIVSMLPR